VAPDLFLGDPRAHAFVAMDGEGIAGWCHGTRCSTPKAGGWSS
jgi:hypothetical protein